MTKHDPEWFMAFRKKSIRAHAFIADERKGYQRSLCEKMTIDGMVSAGVDAKHCKSCEHKVERVEIAKRYETNSRKALRDDIESGFAMFARVVPALTDPNPFLDVVVHSTSPLRAFDWWPRDQIEEHQRSLEEKGAFGIFWLRSLGVRKGPMYTAEFLTKAKDVGERSRIYIAAALFSLDHDLPKTWYGPNIQLVVNALGAFSAENIWNVGCRCVLPVSSGEAFVGLVPPSTEIDGWALGRILGLWIAVCLAGHQLVRITSDAT